MIEAHPLRGEPGQVRARLALVAVGGEVVGPHGVEHHEQHVGPRRTLRPTAESQKQHDDRTPQPRAPLGSARRERAGHRSISSGAS